MPTGQQQWQERKGWGDDTLDTAGIQEKTGQCLRRAGQRRRAGPGGTCASSGTSSGSGGGGSTGGSIHMTVLGSDTGAYAEIGQAMYNGAVAGAAW